MIKFENSYNEISSFKLEHMYVNIFLDSVVLGTTD